MSSGEVIIGNQWQETDKADFFSFFFLRAEFTWKS